MSNVSSDPMIGRLLDGRYQVRSRIARGGMATVYLATDLRLERRVAIKVIHPHLADDAQYRARFIQEARSAARLAHPNVVNVYDQGQDSETAYLVMEYLPGITLRDLLSDHQVLTTEQALDIMEAVLSGLAAAHRSGIVHRDLKPENVLLADDGRIKISDFGLARAASANTATGNALLGTVAYLSPELVTRGVADTRSDIYAVGIMLYEMLAGQQPYRGEQPFQIAQQHANDTVPTPSTRNPAVPAELDELVLWATARDPEQRPHDASIMLSELMDIQRQLSGTQGHQGPQPTMVLPMAVGGTDATQVIAPVKAQRAEPSNSPTVDALAAQSQRRRTRGAWLLGLVLLLAGVAAGAGWYFGAGPGSAVAVPDVAGLTVEEATAALEEQDLVVSAETATAHHPEIPVDHVVGTDPPQGTALDHGATVTLVVSLGPEQLPIPTLVGLAEDEAIRVIEESRFTAAAPRYVFHGSVAEGVVVQALGEGDVDLTTLPSYGEGQQVTLVVSLGAIPDVAGQTVEEAKATLAAVGLTGVEAAEEFHDTIEAGRVIRAQPQQDQAVVPEGGTVNLILSKGVEQVPVPDIEGATWRTARQQLTDAGFAVEFRNPISEFLSAVPDNARVTYVDPPAGTPIDKGSTVTVGLAAG
ncbi:Stk1 family PASTA domain-containing Ser/Thr kinase [Salinibacterium sp. SYSU T00001]|uniref:Stk1 family PASTA domain-containing Ser/Thr kinase n=1 Tax=Homoserinimonas sedimenticola TaxID=2986805 RepID=UPI0022364F77|nr:Stk1 family PASTA domain-containing Ser/Thr kinase [Salinibacterium sedimenticola]MCW4384265.1 Stk1 family PASTA domain-containing Ser/Thr kinase [Salinibacterium sedimenticola]